MKLGIKKGDHLAIWASNHPEWVTTQFATGKIGLFLLASILIIVPLNLSIYLSSPPLLRWFNGIL
ncbi:hypothetical protein L2D08_22095 [Domibacillus sp. PGB-M46]|uniref:hypothetical protein n=1 Tax=Domibacillus sp. PGB-M46 TaxID=2910255 RepID=UPI001F598B50|nr:hypothetical protein [Domibacillus sp. PGB-M46]MCI2257022.1 hypothetical protein [Domibacillus sp. PGB-M46]